MLYRVIVEDKGLVYEGSLRSKALQVAHMHKKLSQGQLEIMVLNSELSVIYNFVPCRLDSATHRTH